MVSTITKIAALFVVVVFVLVTPSVNAEKYKGVLIHDPSEISEIRSYSNSYGMLYSPGAFASFEQVNVDMHVTIVISRYLLDKETGLFGSNINTLVDEVNANRKAGKDILFMLDEPAWLTRLECQEGKLLACEEVNNGYPQTMQALEHVAKQLKLRVPGSKVWHNVAWAELVDMVNKYGHVKMVKNADLYSFDCYGIFNACGDKDIGYYSQGLYGSYVYQEMMYHESQSPTGRKMMLIAGAYVTPGFPNEYAIISQFESYKQYHQSDFVAGTAIFYLEGYRGMDKVENYLEAQFVDW